MKKQTMTIDEKLNSVRAGVLGSNDGILTVVGVLFSVSAASGSSFALMIASVTIVVICQVLPLVFAIVVKGWRG